MALPYHPLDHRMWYMSENDAASPTEGEVILMCMVLLEQMRTILTDPVRGWAQGQLWENQDSPYCGTGPVCLTAALVLALGRPDLHDGVTELDAKIDYHPVMEELDHTIATLYPHYGWNESERDRDLWNRLSPADRVANWNDDTNRSLREVLALIDATVARLGAS